MYFLQAPSSEVVEFDEEASFDAELIVIAILRLIAAVC
jgi:hypothetical protein